MRTTSLSRLGTSTPENRISRFSAGHFCCKADGRGHECDYFSSWWRTLKEYGASDCPDGQRACDNCRPLATCTTLL